MKHSFLFLLGAFLLALSASARDFTYTYEGQTLTYTVISEEAKTCMTKEGNINNSNKAGNNVSGMLIIPSIAMDGNNTEYTVTSISNYAFYDCSGMTSVTIPNSVTSIGDRAFSICSGMTSVTIPESVTSIGNYAFSSCSGMTSVTIPNSVTSIGYYAFYTCDGLKSVTIPSSVTYIKKCTFAWCRNLSSVIIPNSVTSIGEQAFHCCFSLSSVEIPNSVTSIGEQAFDGCSSLRSVTIPNSVTSIRERTFNNCCGLRSVTIPNSVTSIGDRAFDTCLELTSLTIPYSVISIGKKSFYHCSKLNSVIIPNSVTSVGSNAFDECEGLIKSAYPNTLGNPFYSGLAISYPAANSIIEDGFIYDSDKTTIYFAPLSLEGEFSIPNSVSSIGYRAFYNCSGLTSVTIPNSVSSIDEATFYGCSGLTSVTIPNSVTSIGNSAFYGCSGLTSVTIPNSVTSIGNSAFYGCSGLTSVTIPNSVTKIGDSAFKMCSGLTSIEIPNSVSSIGTSAFSGCSGLTSVTISNSVKSINDFVFSGCSGLTSIEIPNSVSSIGTSAFSGCSGLTSVTISNSVKSINDFVFSGCSGLTSVTIPNSVNSIGVQAFDNCSSLNTVVIPSSVNSIGSGAFYGCTSLENFLVPKNLRASWISSYLSASKSEYVTWGSITFKPVSYLKIYDESDNIIPIKNAAVINNSFDYEWTSDNTVKFNNLHPNQEFYGEVLGYKVTGRTDNIYINVRKIDACADMATVEGSFDHASVVDDYYWKYPSGKKIHEKKVDIPYSGGDYKFCVEVNGYIVEKSLDGPIFERPSFSDEDAQATSLTKARLTAKANLSTGATAYIEWRRNDAPDNVKSNEVACPVVNGILMGELRGLKDDVYYQFRPYYSQGGTKYYGKWVGFYTGDAGVYFAPEVGTLSAQVTANNALLEGYAFAGTDDVTSSGIEYRIAPSPDNANSRKRSESEWIRVNASSSLFFKVNVDNLSYDSRYEYRAFAVAGDNTYYGQSSQFHTEPAPSGIEDVVADAGKGLEVKLLENPVKGNLKLIVGGNGEVMECRVYSLDGALMKKCNVVADGTVQEEECNLRPGVYVLVVSGSTGSSSIKMIAR